MNYLGSCSVIWIIIKTTHWEKASTYFVREKYWASLLWSFVRWDRCPHILRTMSLLKTHSSCSLCDYLMDLTRVCACFSPNAAKKKSTFLITADLFWDVPWFFFLPTLLQWHLFISPWYKNNCGDIKPACPGHQSQWASRLHLFLSKLTLQMSEHGRQIL